MLLSNVLVNYEIISHRLYNYVGRACVRPLPQLETSFTLTRRVFFFHDKSRTSGLVTSMLDHCALLGHAYVDRLHYDDTHIYQGHRRLTAYTIRCCFFFLSIDFEMYETVIDGGGWPNIARKCAEITLHWNSILNRRGHCII